MQSYERLLRQVISSRLFKAPAGGQQPALRVATDVQLKLVDTEAQATTLLQMRLELERRPKPAQGKGARGGKGAGGGAAAGAESGGTQVVAAVVDDPPDAMQVAARAAARLGPHETWLATVAIRGGLQRGTLAFVPLALQRLGASHDTVQLSPEAVAAMAGVNGSELVFL